MKLILELDVDDSLVKNRADASKVIRLAAASIEQGASSGFIRNNQTGDESSRWNFEVSRSK